MDVLNKNDYDRCVMDWFKLNQKVLLNKENKKSKILAIDMSGEDSFKFFVKDKKGNYCKDLGGCYGVSSVFDKKGVWCRKEDISAIVEPVYFDVKECLKKDLSLCKEENDEKAKYSKYKNRITFVKSDDSELGLSDDNKLIEVEKAKDAEAIVYVFHNKYPEIEQLLRLIMFLNPENHSTILECIISAHLPSMSSSTDKLLSLLAESELIIDFYGTYYKAVLIKI